VSRTTAQRKPTGYAPVVLLACISCVAAALLFIRCAALQPVAGTGSQAGNGRVTCVIYNSNGFPASGAAVYMRRLDYTADTSGAALRKLGISRYDTFTDAHGAFSIDSVDTGSYCIEVNDGKSCAVLLTCTVTATNTLVRIPGDTLRPTGSIKGAFASAPDAPVALYVQIYGLERIGVRDTATGGFVIRDVPRSSYSLRVLASWADYRPVRIDNVAVVSNQVTDIGKIDFLHLSQWLYSKRLYLNTSAAGADVPGTVTDFPVLIRLRAGTFDFGRAKADGGDLRFTKANGTPLPYEIERWEPVAGRAEVWVGVDTIHGSDSTQSLMMYWGNPSAADSSNGAAVFDTASGFQGIWHLGETDSLAPDATGNRYNGTGYFTASVTGIIGNAQHFNGASSHIRMKGTAPQSRLNFPLNGRYTVSAWIYHDTLADSVTYVIAGKGELHYFMKTFGLAQSTATHAHQWEFTEYRGNDIWHAATFVPATSKTWVYLVGIMDGYNQYLYINGALVMNGFQVFGTGQTTVPRDTSDDFSIGAFLRPTIAWNQGYAWFNGAIDEVDVSSIPRSADWIRLCYMNQKQQDALVKW
jgi:hypothetical protein